MKDLSKPKFSDYNKHNTVYIALLLLLHTYSTYKFQTEYSKDDAL